MKTNKKFLTILTLCIALLLTACGTTDAAGTDKTNESLTETGTVSTDSSNTALNDLYQQENQIFADHEAVWNKVFGMMSKSGVDPSANYADYLADTVEANKDSFTDDELKTLLILLKRLMESSYANRTVKYQVLFYFFTMERR